MKEYYEHLRMDLSGRLKKALFEIAEKETTSTHTRDAVKKILQNRLEDIDREFNRAFIAEIDYLEAKLAQAKEAEKVIALGEKFPSPAAREAVCLWHELVDGFKDDQERRNAILSAGSIVAAFLGTYAK